MTVEQDKAHAADERHWQLSRRSATVLTVLWFAVTFVPPWLPVDLGVDLFGAPASVWFASLGAPVAYLLIVWRHDRRLDRLDRDRRAFHVE